MPSANDIRKGMAIKYNNDVCIVLDAELNRQATGEMKISEADSRVEIWIVPTNEELIVARQTKELISRV